MFCIRKKIIIPKSRLNNIWKDTFTNLKSGIDFVRRMKTTKSS